MGTNPDIEKEIENTFAAAKSIRQVDVSAGYTERTLQRMYSVKEEPAFSASYLLKIAAILVLVFINLYTISHVLQSPVEKPYSQNTSINDLVQDYQVNDISNEWLNNTPVHHE